MKNVAAFLLVNLAFIATNLVAAGLFALANILCGDIENIFLWLLIAIFVIGASVTFLRGAIETLRELAAHF